MPSTLAGPDAESHELELRERIGRLEQSNADLEGFVFAASHDLHEPLRSIQMSLRAVMQAAVARLDPDERRLLAHADAAAAHLSAQVAALLEISQVAAVDEPEPVALDLALGDALGALAAAIREAGADIAVPAPLPSAAVARVEIALVLQNLLANAIKFRRHDRQLRIRICSATVGDVVEVRVADNGIGMTDERRAQVLGAPGRDHPRLPGGGLGLPLCRRIVERRSGSISVASAGPGHGSEITVRLPAGPSTPS